MTPRTLSFVDIETTGTSMYHDRIIEIAIVTVKDGLIVDQFDTLINPQSSVSPFITQMTGISTQDLEEAPSFRELCDEIYERLENTLFVAHNVRFDYGFIKNEFRNQGMSFSLKQLCTVKLSRSLFPRFRKHNLDSIIERHGIVCENRHRALGDTLATYEFYKQVIQTNPPDAMEEIIKRLTKAPSLPSNIQAKQIENLPEHPGVYIFYGEHHMPLYIGKSVNIQDRVKSHFQADHRSSNEMNISRQIVDIETIETPGELGALLLEQHLIKTQQPLYNRKLRLARKLVVLKSELADDGYISLYWETVDQLTPDDLKEVRGIFKSPSQCKSFLRNKSKESGLCDYFMGLEARRPCFASQLGNCHGACTGRESAPHYNNRLTEAFAATSIKNWPYDGPIAIVEQDRDKEQSEGFVIDKWCYIGRVTQQEQDATWEYTNEYVFDHDVYKILVKYVLSPPKNMRVYRLPTTATSTATPSSA